METIARTRTNRRQRSTSRAGGAALGDWIKRRREQSSVSQRELADRAGLSRSYLCDIERGRGTKPSVETLDSIAVALGVDRTELLRVAGILEPARDPEESMRERRLLAVYRGLGQGNQDLLERMARFLLAEEQHWVQAKLTDGNSDGVDGSMGRTGGPTLFDLANL